MLITFFLIAWIQITSVPETCGDRMDMYRSLNRTLEKSKSDRIGKELAALKKKWDDCALEKDSTYTKILHLIGRTYWQDNDLETGIIFTRKAAEINSSGSALVSEKELCNNYYNLGAMYDEKGYFRESIEAYHRSIKAGIKYPDKHPIVSKGYKELASAFFRQGDLEKSALAAEKGLLIAQQLNDKELMAESMIEKAQALIELGHLKEANEILNQVVVFDIHDETQLAAVYSHYAEINVREGNFQQAIDHYEKSFSSFLKSNFTYGCGQASVNLGFIYAEKTGNWNLALKNYERALRYFELPQDRAIVLNEIAGVRNKMGLDDEALRINQEAINLFLSDFTNKDWKTSPHASSIRHVVDKTNLLNIINQKADILLLRHKTKANPTALNSALSAYMLADTMVDFMRWEHNGKASKLVWRDKTRKLYENALETCYELKDVDRAFYFFEKSRAALLQDHLNELGASLLLNIHDQEKESRLKEDVLRLQNQLAFIEGDEKKRLVLRNQLFDAQENLLQFLETIEKSNPSYYAYKYANRGLSIEQLRKDVLTPDQSYLAFFVGENAVYGFYCDGTQTTLKKMDTRLYKEAMVSYQQYLSSKSRQNKDFQGFLHASNSLYQLLVEPFGIRPGAKLVISPDGKFVPFAALSRSPEKESFLIRTNPISYTYSASYLAKTGRKKRKWNMPNSFLGMAPVEFSPSLKQATLPESDKALAKIDKHFVFSKCLEKQNATKSSFLKNIASYPIVQLFTHASADTSILNKNIPKLYFADSTLNLAELNIPFQNATELLVLSACETGIGVDEKGEGVFSLARGFAEAGIPSTLTTLWNVENEAIYEITASFYDGLADGLPLDEALRQAQLKWLSNNEKTGQLPYVWAGNVIIGNTEKISVGWSPFHIWLICFLLLITFFVYFAAKKYRPSKTRNILR